MKIQEVLREIISCLKLFAQDVLALLTTPSEPGKAFALSEVGLKKFPFPEEIEPILDIAQTHFGNPAEYPLNPYALLLAIRASERGRKGFEFGIITVKDTNLQTQCTWACQTIKNTFERFKHQNKEHDFVTFLGLRYAPPGAPNDPDHLNQYWVKNVRYYYGLFCA